MKTTDQRIPVLGELMVLRAELGNDVGMVVDILPSGEQVVLAKKDQGGRVIETVYDTAKLKGLYKGHRVVPGN